jgi:hypothetical protein
MADPTNTPPPAEGAAGVAQQLAESVAHGLAGNQATMEHLQESYAQGEAQIAGSLAANQASLDAGWAQEAVRSQQLDQVFDSLNTATPGVVAGLTVGHPDGAVVDAMPAVGHEDGSADFGDIQVSALSDDDASADDDVYVADIDDEADDDDDADSDAFDLSDIIDS